MARIVHEISPDLKAGCLSSPVNARATDDIRRFFGGVHGLTSAEKLVAAPSQGTPPATVHVYRSSRLEVFHQNESDHWVLHWDEKFFEYVQYFLYDPFTLKDERVAAAVNLFKVLLVAVESQAVRDPAFASAALDFGQQRLRPPADDRRMSDRDRAAIHWIYLFVRLLVYLHEQAHFDVHARTSEAVAADDEVQAALRRLLEQDQWPEAFGDHAGRDELIAHFKAMGPGHPDWEETVVDYLAFKRLMSFEESFTRLSKGPSHEDLLALLYPATMIWHYVCATVGDVRRLVNRPNAEAWAEVVKTALSTPGTGHHRNNLRGFLVRDLVTDKVKHRKLDGGRHAMTALNIATPLLRQFYTVHTTAFRHLLALDWPKIAAIEFEETFGPKEMRAVLAEELLY